jgi:hypothetical protein
VLLAAGFAAFRDLEDARSASRANRVLLIGLIAVSIPLAFESWERYQENAALANIVQAAEAWAPDFEVRGVDIDHTTDPVLVEVTVVGPKEPPSPDRLAELAAGDLERPVLLEVTWAPMTAVEVTAP